MAIVISFESVFTNYNFHPIKHQYLETKCTTGRSGPAPFTPCKFPFVFEGIKNYGCLLSQTPSAYDPRCKELLKKIGRPNILNKGYDRVSKILSKSCMINTFTYNKYELLTK